jgi:Flp pilus assembly protein TadG
MHTSLNIRKATSRERFRGAILLEAILIIPILLILLTGTVNFASIFWQMEVVQEGLRFASRRAANRSHDGVACTELINEARNYYVSFVTTHARTMGIALDQTWTSPPDVCFTPLSYNGYSGWGLRVTVNTQNQNNCIFCYASIASKLFAKLSKTFLVEWRCSGPALACPVTGP